MIWMGEACCCFGVGVHQVFDGVVTLACPSEAALASIVSRLEAPPAVLAGTHFGWGKGGGGPVMVTDPWGRRADSDSSSMDRSCWHGG
jgi:hypothetical protein